VRNTVRNESGDRYPTLRAIFSECAFETHYQPDSIIALHGTPADAVYLIVSGTVRCCTLSAEGDRQIFSFATKGEFVGVTDIETWHFTAEATDHVILKSVARTRVEQALAVDASLRHEFRAYLCRQLEKREKQLFSLVTSKASERVMLFLSDFANTRTSHGFVALPMCRRDIADHLGLSVETVSRAFSELKAAGRIDLIGAEKYRILPDTPKIGQTEQVLPAQILTIV
jgi:CRP/FNR family transcriptional regulator, nitrogen fixation regulation protein